MTSPDRHLSLTGKVNLIVLVFSLLILMMIRTLAGFSYLIRNLNLLMFLSAIPVPRTTALNGSSATQTGKPVFR